MVLDPNWKKCEKIAEKLYHIIHEGKKPITFFEIDCILNLLETQCTTQKYLYVLGKAVASDIPRPDLNHTITEAGKRIYG